MFIAVLGWMAGFGALAGWMAHRKHRSVGVWAVYGAILGPGAAVILGLAPPGYCGVCLDPVRGWRFRCGSCGSDVRDRPALVAAGAKGVADVAGTPAKEVAGPARPARRATRTRRPRAEQARSSDGASSQRRAAGRAAPASPADDAAKPSAPSGSSTPAPEATPVGRPTADASAGNAGSGGTGSGGTGSGGAGVVEAERRIMASAVYLGGSAPLLHGARYVIACRGMDLQVLGPVDTQPDQVVLSRRLNELDISGLGDRLTIVGASKRLQGFNLIFMGLAGRSAEQVDRDLEQIRDGLPADAGSESGR